MKKIKDPAYLGELVYYSEIKSEKLFFSEIFVWDLDKTYLDTRLESIMGIWTAAVERSLSKKNIPGSSVLIRQLSKSWKEKKGQREFPLFFITASPPQMEERIREKLLYDGIQPLGYYYKNNLRNLRPSRWWRLRKHVGYKISALLHLRRQLPENVEQVLWGDDSESDAIIYNLYSDICAQRIEDNELKILLKKIGMAQDNIDLIFQLKKDIPPVDPVTKIYINLAVDTDHDYYLKFGRRTVPTYNSFQMALDLFQDHRLQLEDVLLVYQEMIEKYGYSREELIKSFEELVRRPQIGKKAVGLLVEFFKQKNILCANYDLPFAPREEIKKTLDETKVLELEGFNEPWVQDKIEYLNEYR